MSGSNEKGNFSADIAQEVINAALQSVQRRSTQSHAEEGVSLDVEAAAPPDELPVEAPSEGASAEVAELTAALAEARKEAENLRAQLDFSQGESRKLMERLKADHERSLRAAADLENYKKRAQKEKEEVQKFGSEKLLKDILPVMDNLDRAMDAAAKSPDFTSFQKGVAMTRKSFEDTLSRHGVKAFSAQGQAFDPRLHEAMSQAETADVPAGHVAYEVLRGYHLNERLIRPAMVVVARAPAPPPEPVAAAPEAPAATTATTDTEAGAAAAPEAGDAPAVPAETGHSAGGSQ
ncbi:nucleotide exchange factor GrpE [Stigmatella aurantiaca]|uniref:Protein GrpE n=1 Tax=Stigmatella aurantiaca (strain DW4/3-1) TaxID=378806 RepID=E3FHG0_STIAD|nr:nucleotide exchange factor GrpE [Stigmatella aurantiaca]ADO69032.1 Molecular chaperone GrpE (heat shock protein) [Stigmatella aurantiaca DW4/3-1]